MSDQVGGEVHGFRVFHQIIIRRAARVPRLFDPVHKLFPNLFSSAQHASHGSPLLLRQAKVTPAPPRENHFPRGAPCRPVFQEPGLSRPG